MTEEMIKQIKRLLFDYTEVYDDEPIFQELELLIKDNYISKDKIRKEIEKTEKELYNGEILQRFAYIKIETLKDLLKE